MTPFFSDLLRDNTPRVMGILNVTPDSFSDGGRFLDPSAALDRALRMQEEGAAVIDVGAESTRPGAAPVSGEEELARLTPVVTRLVRELKAPLSIDTSKLEVMRAMLDLGVRVINDVRAMRADSRIPALIAERSAAVVLMHSRGEPGEMQKNTDYSDLVGEVIEGLKQARGRAVAAGVRAGDIAVDPGIGFGKSAEGNWELLRALPRIERELGCPVLVGLSRKSFLTRTFGVPIERIAAPMAAAHLAALEGGARILRAHDIIEAVQTIQVFQRTRNR
jgi:dihydropteroate synthase